MAKHYVISNDAGHILRGFSDDFEQPDAKAICINEDGGRHFELNGVEVVEQTPNSNQKGSE